MSHKCTGNRFKLSNKYNLDDIFIKANFSQQQNLFHSNNFPKDKAMDIFQKTEITRQVLFQFNVPFASECPPSFSFLSFSISFSVLYSSRFIKLNAKKLKSSITALSRTVKENRGHKLQSCLLAQSCVSSVPGSFFSLLL